MSHGEYLVEPGPLFFVGERDKKHAMRVEQDSFKL